MGDVIKIPEKTAVCACCQRRPATRLCDAPVGRTRYVGHPPRSEVEKAKHTDTFWKDIRMSTTITCDRLICDWCAIEVIKGVDYCPDCAKRVREALQRRTP